MTAPTLREVAEALLAAEGESLSIPKRQRVCSYCNGPVAHDENPACPVHLARLALNEDAEGKHEAWRRYVYKQSQWAGRRGDESLGDWFERLHAALSAPAPTAPEDVAGLVAECEQRAGNIDNEWSALERITGGTAKSASDLLRRAALALSQRPTPPEQEATR